MSHGYCTYPGVLNVLSAEYTLTHGISPGVINMEIVPQTTDVAAIGPVVFYYGNETLTLLDCKADQAATVKGSGGTITALAIKDRRWRWQYSECYGHYNQRDEDGQIITATKRTVQDLALILLSCMGESCDVSALPNITYDEVEWVGDNAAYELQEICERFGCSIILRANSQMAIVRLGTGATLPYDALLMEAQQAANPPDLPATIKIVGAPVLFQARLDLEAVAEDVDGRIRPIDLLSYKPAVSAGWGRQFDYFSDVTDDTARKLAIRDVFKLYRIRDQNAQQPKAVVSGVPGIGNVNYLRQILPLHDGLVQSGADSAGDKRRIQERIVGTYFIRNLVNPINSSTSNHYQYKGQFDVDRQRGLVRFPEQVVKYDSSSKLWVQAELKLECSFNVADNNSGAMYRYYYSLPTGAFSGSGVEVIRHEELLWEQFEYYSSNTASAVWKDKVSQSALDEYGATYAYGRLYSYFQENATSGHYAGLRQFSPDGAIQQVTWSVGPGGTTTSVSRVGETHPYAPTRKKRTYSEWLRQRLAAQRSKLRGRR